MRTSHFREGITLKIQGVTQSQEFERDEVGRFKYAPEIHFAHGKKMSEYERAYLCKFYEFDGLKSMSFALGRTEMTVSTRFQEMKNKGEIGHYKRLWERQFEEGVIC